jgi:hypothetical protein
VAYIASKSFNYTGSVTDGDIDLPSDIQADDVIYLHIYGRGGSTPTFTANDGFSLIGSKQNSSASAQQWAYKVATGTEGDTNITVTASVASYFTLVAIVVRDADVTGTPHLQASAGMGKGYTYFNTNVDASLNGSNQLVFHSFSQYNNNSNINIDAHYGSEVYNLANPDNNNRVKILYKMMDSAGVTEEFYYSSANQGQESTLAVKNKTNGYSQAYVKNLLANTFIVGGAAGGHQFDFVLGSTINVSTNASTNELTFASGHGLVQGDRVIALNAPSGFGNNFTVGDVFICGTFTGDTCQVYIEDSAYASATTWNSSRSDVQMAKITEIGSAGQIVSTLDGINVPDYETMIWYQRGALATTSSYNPPTSSGEYVGFTWNYSTSKDFTGLTWCCTLGNDYFSNSAFVAKFGLALVFQDSSSNWASFRVARKSQFQGETDFTFTITPENAVSVDNSGTVDFTSIDKVSFLFHRGKNNTSSKSLYYRGILEVDKNNPIILYGGSPDKPITINEITAAYATTNYDREFVESQGSGQFLHKFSIQIGDGVNKTYCNGFASSYEMPLIYSELSPEDFKFNSGVGSSGLVINASDDCVMNFSNAIIASDNFQLFEVKNGSSLFADYSFTGCNFVQRDCSIDAISITGASFVNCKEVSFVSAMGDYSGGNTFSNLADGEAAYFTITGANETELQTNFAKLNNCTFNNNSTAILINYTGSATIDMTSMTFSGNTVDIEYNGTGTLTLTKLVTQAENSSATGGGSIVYDSPTVSLTITSSEASSDIKIFTAGTQTEITPDSNDGTTAILTTAGTYDVTVMKKGFLPQRELSITLGGSNVPKSYTLATDPVYDPLHDLTYSTDQVLNDFYYDRTTHTLTQLTRQSGRKVYSALIDAYIDQSSLDNTEFRLQAVGIDSIFFNDATIDSDVEELWHETGIRYLESGVTTAEWVSIKSSGAIPSGVTGRYQTGQGTGTQALRAEGVVDQAIKVYGDSNNGNFDYRNYLVIKFQANPYIDTRSDILALAGVSQLEPFEYSVAISPEQLDITEGDPSITADITFTDHGVGTELEIDDNGTTRYFRYEILDTGTNSAEDILREWDWSIAQTGNYQDVDTFNLPEFIAQSGSTYETRQGIVESEGSTLYGCFVSRGTSGTAHPDFTRHQSDDGSYYVKPILADGVVQGMPTTGDLAWLQVRNLGGGGGTVGDIYNNSIATSAWTDSYVNGTTVYADDVIRVRFAMLTNTGSNAFATFENTVVATATGYTMNVSAITDTVYATNNLNGLSTDIQNLFDADYSGGDPEIDLAIASNFEARDAYAFYCSTLVTDLGIENFWGGVTAIDSGNYRINTGIANIYFDNNTTTNIRQTDDARIYRDDNNYPIKNNGATTGGGGVDINWKNQVFVTSVATGDAINKATVKEAMTEQGYSPSRATKIDTVDIVDSNIDEVKVRLDLDPTKPNTYANDGSSITNADFTLTRTDNGTDSTVTRS